MNTHDLLAFVTVVETGSIVAAAARLHLTQPAITRRIQNLEQLLGTTLLDRQSKPLKPTRAGREAYEHGRRVLRSIDDLKSGLAPVGEVSGEFRLGIAPYLSEVSLAGPIDRLCQSFPKLGLRVTAGWSPRLIEQVLASEVDTAAVWQPLGVEPPDLLAREDLGCHSVLVVAARTLEVPRPMSLKALSGFSWILNQDGCGYRAEIRHIFEAARLPFQVGIEALSPDLRLSLVARGLGIGLITPGALAVSPLRDRLQVLDVPDFRPQVRAWIIYRAPAGRLARPIDMFRDLLRAQLDNEKEPAGTRVSSPRRAAKAAAGRSRARSGRSAASGTRR